MESPRSIEFIGNSLTVLKQSLIAASPEEGCALLLGQERENESSQANNTWLIQFIWPCCNIWEPGSLKEAQSPKNLNSSRDKSLSKKNRFLIDPREQLLAQRWARERNWRILGSAHSHPTSKAIPSSSDLLNTFSPGLTVILGQSGEIKAWWINNNQTFYSLEVAFSQSQ